MNTKNHLRIFLAFFVIALTVLACGGGTTTGGTNQPTNVIFQDDFSNTSSGWDTIRVTDQGITDYENGVYRIQVLTTDTTVWANPNQPSQGDVKVEVDATKVGGPDDNLFGVICRYEDAQNYYFFVISSDGYYGIGKVKDNNQVLINMPDDLMQPTGTITQGAASNHIRADCVGSQLTLYVNGQQVDSKTDTDIAAGDVGLIAGTSAEAGVDINFDNFLALKP